MAYEKQTWSCGDVVTAEKMNHIENGIEECCGGGSTPLVINVTKYADYDEGTYTYTWDGDAAQLRAAWLQGQTIQLHFKMSDNYDPNPKISYIGGLVVTEVLLADPEAGWLGAEYLINAVGCSFDYYSDKPEVVGGTVVVYPDSTIEFYYYPHVNH